MRQRIQVSERDGYVRIVARVPADLEHACRRLARSEGWILGDLCRSLIVLAACGSYLTLRSSEPRTRCRMAALRACWNSTWEHEPTPLGPEDARSSSRSACRPASPASLALYSKLMARLRSHVYTRFLRAGLLMYLTSEQRLAESLKAASPRASVDANHCRR